MADNIVPILRLLIIMVARDGQVRSRERDYLAWLMDKYEVPQRTRAELLAELNHPPRVSDVFPTIKSARDRARVVDLLRIVMEIDGNAAASERALFNEVVEMQLRLTVGEEQSLDARTWRDIESINESAFRRWWRRFF